MTPDKDTKNAIIKNAFDKWAEKKWFQIVFVIFVLYIMAAPIVGPFIYNEINKQNTQSAVVQGINEQKHQEEEKHRLDFEKSKQAYAAAKTVLKNGLESTGSDYIFLIEYHNGMDNVVTGIQFCRFDITLEVLREDLRYIDHSKFKDDIVARYDLLLSDTFQTASRAFYYTVEELWSVDRYLEKHILSIDGKAICVINLTAENGQIWGTLLFVTTEDNTFRMENIYTVRREIETIFRK
jgi:hypothetical protein